jgi:hypothetical protein
MPAGMHDAMPNVVAKLSNGQTCTLFEFYPDELGFEAHEFLGLTVAEAKGLKAQKDREYLKSSQRQRYESAGG